MFRRAEHGCPGHILARAKQKRIRRRRNGMVTAAGPRRRSACTVSLAVTSAPLATRCSATADCLYTIA